MLHLYDENATKKPTNLSINSDLLTKSRELKINLSATLERALERELRATEREIWLKENQQAIDAYNKLVDEEGVFSDGLRSF